MKVFCSKIQQVIQTSPGQLKIYRKIVEICNPGCFNEQVDSFGLRRGQVFEICGWVESVGQNNTITGSQVYLLRTAWLICLRHLVHCSAHMLSIKTQHPTPQQFDQHLKELRHARELLNFCVSIFVNYVMNSTSHMFWSTRGALVRSLIPH